MVSYKVVTTTKALSQLEAYIDYIQYTLLNKQAANAVWNDAMETVNQLENVAGSLRYCDDSDLMKLGYRKINFIHHRDGCPWFIENRGCGHNPGLDFERIRRMISVCIPTKTECGQ